MLLDQACSLPGPLTPSCCHYHLIWLHALLTSAQSQQFPVDRTEQVHPRSKDPLSNCGGLTHLRRYCCWGEVERRGFPLLLPSTQAAQDPPERPAHLLVAQGVDDGVDQGVALCYHQAELLVGVGVAFFAQQPVQ